VATEIGLIYEVKKIIAYVEIISVHLSVRLLVPGLLRSISD
jgi:hypothetical protein